VSLQKRFLGHFLHGHDNGWPEQPRVMLRVRTVDGGFVDRTEEDWPIPRTRWTRRFLDPASGTLAGEPPPTPAKVSFEARTSDGVTFSTAPFEEETEITGPVSATLFVSSSTSDADLFLVLGAFDPDGREVVFQGAVDPHTPMAQGWLRASHRKLDPDLSAEHRPYHVHDEVEPLAPDEVYRLDIEIWPTSLVLPAGYRVALNVRGRDYEYGGPGAEAQLGHFKGSRMRGVGIYTHGDPDDRPAGVFDGTTTIHAGPETPSAILLPVVPPR
jgi:predicted acyl esterase